MSVIVSAIALIAVVTLASCTRSTLVERSGASATDNTATPAEPGASDTGTSGSADPADSADVDPTTSTTAVSPTTSPTTTGGPEPGPDTGIRYDYFNAPPLGSEPVRGSGCGADGSLGDTIPDGWWYGIPNSWGASSFEFDVICVYTGAEGQRRRAECVNDAEPDICFESGADDFWIVNNNARTRTVPVSPNIEIFNQSASGCPEYDIRTQSFVSLIHIANGEAVYLATTCPGG